MKTIKVETTVGQTPPELHDYFLFCFVTFCVFKC